MGFDYERQKFTTEPHQMLAAQVTSLVCELKAGESGIVHNEHTLVDRETNRGTWINGYSEVLSDNTVIALGETDPELYARIFCVRQGLIIDRSHLHVHKWDWNNRLSRKTPEESIDMMMLPVIYCAYNLEELDIIKPALKKAGIKIKSLNTISALIQAIEESDEIEDDSDLEEIDSSSDEE